MISTAGSDTAVPLLWSSSRGVRVWRTGKVSRDIETRVIPAMALPCRSPNARREIAARDKLADTSHPRTTGRVELHGANDQSFASAPRTAKVAAPRPNPCRRRTSSLAHDQVATGGVTNQQCRRPQIWSPRTAGSERPKWAAKRWLDSALAHRVRDSSRRCATSRRPSPGRRGLRMGTPAPTAVESANSRSGFSIPTARGGSASVGALTRHRRPSRVVLEEWMGKTNDANAQRSTLGPPSLASAGAACRRARASWRRVGGDDDGLRDGAERPTRAGVRSRWEPLRRRGGLGGGR